MSTLFAVTRLHAGGRRVLNLAAKALWHMPGRFGIVRSLGFSYSLRCVLFHNVSDTESAFTKGLNVTTNKRRFVAALKFLSAHYTPVRLQDVLSDSDGRELPPRPVLVTFDDTYASVAEIAAPLCEEFGIPAVFFVNAEALDNVGLALDNLVCYAVNVLGLDKINAVARGVTGIKNLELRSLAQIFGRLLPTLSLQVRGFFRDALADLVRARERGLAAEAGLYLTRPQLRGLAAYDFEIGNHTYSHVHCRTLSHKSFSYEIDGNKAELEAVSGRKVRSFSVPYGSSIDLTADLARHLRLSGHEAVFLSESVANRGGDNGFRFDRVSSHAGSDEAFFSEIEVLPRLRAMRNRLFRARYERPRRGEETAGTHLRSRG
jgi:peptidoglycan/xylan/chitin deacetylase (PgdA/CDA1 family)